MINSSPIIGGSPGNGNFFRNNHAGFGSDLADLNIEGAHQISAGYNTFLGFFLSDYYVYPLSNFNTDNCQSLMTPIQQDVYVSPDGDDNNQGISPDSPFKTLSQAVRSIYAESNNPISVHLAPGAYPSGELLPIPFLPYTRFTCDGPGMAVFVLESGETGFYAKSDSIIAVNGLTFSGSATHAMTVIDSDLQIQNCIIQNFNSPNPGAAIYCDNAEIVCEDSSFIGNCSTKNGGAAALYNHASMLLSQCNLQDNCSEKSGGAVFLSTACYAQATECSWQNNSAQDSGGAICFSGVTSSVIQNCEFIGNSAGLYGGSIYCGTNANPIIGGSLSSGNVFQYNRSASGSDLASLTIPASPITASGNTFEGYHLSDYYVSPQLAFDLSLCSSSLIPMMADLYISPFGDDENDGLSWASPLQSISYALTRIYGTPEAPVSIHLQAGVYSEDLTHEQFPLPMIPNVNLIGFQDGTSRIHNTHTNGTILFANDANIRIENLSLDEGQGPGFSITSSSPEIHQCTISNLTTASNGGGIYCRNANPIIDSCTITNNVSTQSGGGIYCTQSSNLTITNSTISYNQAQNDGGGILWGYQSIGTIQDCMIQGNISHRDGGGICCFYGSPSIQNCSFWENKSTHQGGAICCVESEPVISGYNNTSNVFHSNFSPGGSDLTAIPPAALPINAQFNFFQGSFASDYYVSKPDQFDLAGCVSQESPICDDLFVAPNGDDINDGLSWNSPLKTIQKALSMAACIDQSEITIHLAEGLYSPSQTGEILPLPLVDGIHLQGIEQNSIIDGENSSGIMEAFQDSDVQISGLTLTNSLGPAINLEQSTAIIQDCLLSQNFNPKSGAGIRCIESNPLIYQCSIESNVTNQNGAGIFIDGNSNPQIYLCSLLDNSADKSGGGIYFNACNPEILSCDVVNNTAESGGGILGRNSQAAKINDCMILNNQSTTGAGVLLSNTEINLINCLFHGNSASGTQIVSGGGLHAGSSALNIENCTFSENSAEGQFQVRGAGISGESGTEITMSNCILWNNWAPQGSSISLMDAVEPSSIIIDHSDIQNGLSGIYTSNGSSVTFMENVFDLDPLFVESDTNICFLSQIASGQTVDSPCLNSGSANSSELCFHQPDGIICMDELSTRTDHIEDFSQVDLGFHYPASIGFCLHTGDIDENLQLTPADALMAFQIYLELLPEPSITQECAADCDGSGSVTPGDAQCIFFHYLSAGCSCMDPLIFPGIQS